MLMLKYFESNYYRARQVLISDLSLSSKELQCFILTLLQIPLCNNLF